MGIVNDCITLVLWLRGLDQAENPKPGICVVWFDFVTTRSEATAVERPLFDLCVGWYVVPSFEVLLVLG